MAIFHALKSIIEYKEEHKGNYIYKKAINSFSNRLLEPEIRPELKAYTFNYASYVESRQYPHYGTGQIVQLDRYLKTLTNNVSRKPTQELLRIGVSKL